MTNIKNISSILIAAILLMLITSCSSKTEVEELAPNFTATTKSNEEFTLSDERGNYILLDFWASWCAPCIKDFPKIKGIHDTYKNVTFNNGGNFLLIGIALEKKEASWEKAIDRYDLDYTHHILNVSRFVRTASLANDYGVTNIPHTFLIDDKGNIVGENMSGDQIKEYLESQR